MTRRTVRCVWAACIIASALAIIPALSAQVPETSPEAEALQALLQEIQLLRTAIEPDVSVNSPMELALSRIDVATQQVSNLSVGLQAAQSDRTAISAQNVALAQQLADLAANADLANAAAQPDSASRLPVSTSSEERRLMEAVERENQLRKDEADARVALEAAEERLKMDIVAVLTRVVQQQQVRIAALEAQLKP